MKNINLVGRVPAENVADYMKAFDILVVPTIIEEGFGRVVAEGQVNDCVVIAFRSGGIPELIENEKTGFLVDKGDIKSVAEHISALSNNPEQRQTILSHLKGIEMVYVTGAEGLTNIYKKVCGWKHDGI